MIIKTITPPLTSPGHKGGLGGRHEKTWRHQRHASGTIRTTVRNHQHCCWAKRGTIIWMTKTGKVVPHLVRQPTSLTVGEVTKQLMIWPHIWWDGLKLWNSLTACEAASQSNNWWGDLIALKQPNKRWGNLTTVMQPCNIGRCETASKQVRLPYIWVKGSLTFVRQPHKYWGRPASMKTCNN